MKYLRCILIGLPLWFVIGILVTFSPEISKALQIQGEIDAAHAVAFAYLGITFGGFASGFFSQQLRSRKKIVFAFILFTLAAMAAYFFCAGFSAATFYLVISSLGFGVGYWAVFVTIAAEQFGTNIRATVATTVPNFVRGCVVPLTLGVQFFEIVQNRRHAGGRRRQRGHCRDRFAFWSRSGRCADLMKRYGKDLDYTEPV